MKNTLRQEILAGGHSLLNLNETFFYKINTQFTVTILL